MPSPGVSRAVLILPRRTRWRLARLLSRSNKAMRAGIQLSEAIEGDGARIFRHACALGLEGIVSKRLGSRYVSGRTRAWLKTKNPNFEPEQFRAGESDEKRMVDLAIVS
jgi:ATP-dependent DNA ligase